MKTNKQGIGCLLLFFLPFALVGIGMLYMGLKDLYLQNKTSNWIPVEAHIKDVEFITYSSGKGGTSYETKCTYSYSYKKKNYSNNIIARGYRANSNRNHRQLHELLKYTNIVTAYVNPDKPNNAVLVKGGILLSKISLLVISISIFVFIAVFFNSKNKVFFFSFSFIFVAGILLLSSGILQANFKDKIIVIKKKTKEEIDQMNEDFMDQYVKEHPLKEDE